MNILFVILSIMLAVNCILLVTVILMQKKKASGISGAITGGGSAAGSTHWDKNKGRSAEGQLEKYTKMLGISFFIITFAMGFIR